MSWLEYRLPFSPDPDHAPTEPAETLPKMLWERWLRPGIGNRVRGRAYQSIIAGGYLDAQATGALSTGRWTADGGVLVFRFHDGDGLFVLQAQAAAHFVEVAWAELLTSDHFGLAMRHEGWRFHAERDAAAVLETSGQPLIELRGTLYLAGPGATPDAPPTLRTDPRLPVLTFALLDATEREAVTRAVVERRCACVLCEYHRPRVAKVLARRAANASKAAKGRPGEGR
jgi:hypothetical protein